MTTVNELDKKRMLMKRDTDELVRVHEKNAASMWRATYHVQPVTGLMNDPNGFTYCNKKWHLFYQWFPFGPVHGLKHWYHVTSPDLIHWENRGVALLPTGKYENCGCYSGTAISEGDTIYFAYTGNYRDENRVRRPHQLLATLEGDEQYTKAMRPLITPNENYTEHQRDPKIVRIDDMYYIFLGAQNKQEQGVILVYCSDSILTDWKFLGELKVKGYENGFGYMVECPDVQKIGLHDVLIFSPQGIEPSGDEFRNKFNSVYLIGDLDLETLTFTPDGPMQELDRGFDFYAPQCASQNVYSDCSIMSAWFGVPDYTYPPTDEEGWSGLQTFTRELTIRKGKLYQTPVRGFESLKKDELFCAKNGEIISDKLHGQMPSSAIIRIENPDAESLDLNLFSRNYVIARGFAISYEKYTKRLRIDRSDLTNQLNVEYGTDRQIILENGLTSMDIFVDHSTVEIFVNEGEYVLSSRIFPTKEEHMIRMGGKNLNLSIWSTEPSVDDAPVFFAENQ